MHILIAPNAFKNSLAADKAAAAIQRGLLQSRLVATSECFPVGDGGDGTGDLLIGRLGAQRISATAGDPLGRMIETYFGLSVITVPGAGSPGATAIIEMANASGLRLLPRAIRDPLHASSTGTGDLIRAALDQHANHIILGMGGSATVDGGAGILQALGVGFYNSDGQPLVDLPLELGDLVAVDMANVDPRLFAVELIVLCDVTNPLTGPNGAAAVFGPQKGALPAAVRRLESGLIQFAEIIARRTGVDLSGLPRGGTAGGAAAGLHGLLGAKLVSGIDYFLEITGFDRALEQATHVLTGEGSIDRQTLQGKAPFGVACRAKAKGIPVIALTGRRPDDPAALQPYFDEIISINPPGTSFPVALANTAANLERAALEWGNRV